MPLLAGSVIDAARDRNAAFAKERHPNKGALRFLSGYVKALHGKILGIDPDVLRLEVPTALPLVDHEAGIALPANTQQVVEAAARYPAAQNRNPFPVTIIDAGARNALNSPRGAAWQIGNTLYLRSPATLWRDFDEFAVAVVVLPVDLVALDDTLAIPDAAELACVTAVATYFAEREAQEVESRINLSVFEGRAAKAEGDYLGTVLAALSGKTFFTQDVWHP